MRGPFPVRFARSRDPRLPSGILVSDPVRLPDPSGALARLGPGGAVHLRLYGMPAAEAARVQARVLGAARRARVRVVLARDSQPAALPRTLGGIHLPEALALGRLPLARLLLWRRAAPERTLCMATHNARALGRARSLGADYVLLSPMFPTRSHPGAPVLGAVRAALLARQAGVPVYALGGVTPRTVRRLPPGTFRGVAGIDTFTLPGA
ncbi:thiamine phosphate synthase [Phaeovibrio sulfidiphilus]|uniref:Thiamine phosphate synthase n=1 Tax=Phaeovibrio sulfidiphilus TaxID=1220600 RepID=A0A8J7CP94_9PROT|nr:thiamine phosphate synthase [Phaeovibrio sulfidiphilus]MBE1236782.1 thiamine phosphate synthase [Phaeovibrio sulfidiphilus]